MTIQREEDENEDEIVTGLKVYNPEELLDPESPRRSFYNYLFDFEHEKLKLIQSYMLIGRYILNGVKALDKYDNNTIIEIFEENFEKFSHQNDKGMMSSYISEKTLKLDDYLEEGLKAFKRTN